MINRLKRVFNSAMCEFSMLAIIVCMIVSVLALKHDVSWNSLSAGAALAGGAVLVVLLVWATVVIATGRTVREMSPRPRLIVESLSRLLLFCWLLLATSLPFALMWLVFIVWDGVRSFREAWSDRRA